MRYDIVIIGSGFGGLACGRLLARSGRSVLVLERQRQPGGCLQSYRRGAFAFDTGVHYVGGLAEGQPLHEAFSRLGLLRLPWHRLDAEGFDRVTIGDQTYAFAEGFDRFVETMATAFPKERKALTDYARLLERLPTVEEIGEVSAYGYLSDTFRDPLLVNVLSGTSLKMELRRESLPLFIFAHGNSSFIQSSWRLKGDGNLIVRSLTDDIRGDGGLIICGAEVDRLDERDGRIVAAHTSNGEVYEGDVFISDVHPAITFDWLSESSLIKPLFRRRIRSMENTFGMFTASLVLKPDTLPYFNHNKYVYRKPNVWTFYEMEDPVGGVMVSCRVPEGTFARQIDLMTPMPWSRWRQWADTQIGQRGEDYEQLKLRLATECIGLAERVIPGLATMVEQCHTSTPLTYRDYTLTPDGSAYGVRKDCRNLLMTMLSPRTPVSNLLLTGQNLMLHGLEGVAMTALKTVENVI